MTNIQVRPSRVAVVISAALITAILAVSAMVIGMVVRPSNHVVVPTPDETFNGEMQQLHPGRSDTDLATLRNTAHQICTSSLGPDTYTNLMYSYEVQSGGMSSTDAEIFYDLEADAISTYCPWK